MKSDNGLLIHWEPVGKGSLCTITAKQAGEVIHVDQCDPTKSSERERFRKIVCDGRPGIDSARLDKELLRIAGEGAGAGSGNGKTDATEKKHRKRRKPVVRCVADVEPKKVSWAWWRRVPQGRITLLAGAAGIGKSFLTYYMAARVSTGKPWTDGNPCERGSVILLCAEDDESDTIRPRLDEHNADVSRIHLIPAVQTEDENGKAREVVFTLEHVDMLEEVLQEIDDCKLIVIDPIGSYLGAGTDAHRDNQVRAVLAPVAALAEKFGPAVVIVAHWRKATSTVADDLVLGSRAFTAIARASWHLCCDPEDEKRLLLVPGKCNLAPKQTGLAFRIEGEPGKVQWEDEPVRLTADQVVSMQLAAGNGKSKVKEAEDWLREFLNAGPRPGKEVRAEASRAGISHGSLKKAKEKLHIIDKPLGQQSKWHWRLPDWEPEGQTPAELPESPKGKKSNDSGNSGKLWGDSEETDGDWGEIE